ncbi:PAS domain-containing protein [Streptomyces turgidiscabies]|nr:MULTISPECIES: PAS domain-containing protein [Streptomyces]MDX3500093.1 PAS domain-containing protein [Streptomyces turgidiscabies]
MRSAPTNSRTPTTPGLGAEAVRASTSLLSRVGAAEWNLQTGETSWSTELYRIFGRVAHEGPLPLDELHSGLHPEDQQATQAYIAKCLTHTRLIDCEFRVIRDDSGVRTLHMMAEPVMDTDGVVQSVWAVVRDVTELRRPTSG